MDKELNLHFALQEQNIKILGLVRFQNTPMSQKLPLRAILVSPPRKSEHDEKNILF